MVSCLLPAPLTTGHFLYPDTPNRVIPVASETPTIFGMPAIAVPQPKGESALYVIRDEPLPAAWMAGKWSITSADGKTYTVTESKGGHWHCSCRAMEFPKSRKHTLPSGQSCCKHCIAIHDRKYGVAVEAEESR